MCNFARHRPTCDLNLRAVDVDTVVAEAALSKFPAGPQRHAVVVAADLQPAPS